MQLLLESLATSSGLIKLCVCVCETQVLPPYQSPSGTTCSAYLFAITKPAGLASAFGPHLSMLSTRRDNKPTHTHTQRCSVLRVCVSEWEVPFWFCLNFVSCRHLIWERFVNFLLQIWQFGRLKSQRTGLLKAEYASKAFQFLFVDVLLFCFQIGSKFWQLFHFRYLKVFSLKSFALF